LNVTGHHRFQRSTVPSGATLGVPARLVQRQWHKWRHLGARKSIGTLTVNGNLTLAAGSAYSVEVSPTAADRTTVSGTASVNGTVIASVTPGAYAFGQRFTILSATGGVSGAFASLTGIPAS
jgi:uncharacterized protein with beta-barrel porin domain